MKNVTISLDERVLNAARKRASALGVSLQAFLRQIVAKEVDPKKSVDLARMFSISRDLGARSGGWKFNREEIYDRKVLRR